MKVHEYQTKEILKRYGVPVPKGGGVNTHLAEPVILIPVGGRGEVVSTTTVVKLETKAAVLPQKQPPRVHWSRLHFLELRQREDYHWRYNFSY